MNSANLPLVPPLQNGDRLTRAEFERRWDATPNLKVAELIDGIVYIPNVGVHTYHGNPCAHLVGWTVLYAAGTPGIEGGCHSSIRLDDRNELQPDALLFVDPSHGGQTLFDSEDFLASVPDWVGEVTSSHVSYDYHAKLPVYRRNGVPECLIWRTRENAIDCFILRGNDYQPLPLSAEGYYKSEALPGLWLDPRAMIARDRIAVQRVLDLGLASLEHQQFVGRLSRQASACR